MPKREIDYSKAFVYKLACKDPSITETYIGSSTNFKQRKSLHKSDCNLESSPRHNNYVYKFIRENGGWENWEMVKLEDYPCEDSLELRKREREWLEEYQASLNKNIPSRPHNEAMKAYYEKNKDKIKAYYENNKDKITAKKKAYYEKNKEERLEKTKEYNKRNREKIKEYQRKWKQCNREKIREHQREYYERNKEKMREYQRKCQKAYRQKRKQEKEALASTE
jgi:hypothetical protein